MNGADGTSCTLTGADGGTRTLTCGADGGAITVVDAVADYATMTADEKAQAAMAAVITGVSFPADGRPVVKIKVSERHGLGVKNLSATAVSWRFALLKLAAGRQRQRQRHLGQLPRRERSLVGLQPRPRPPRT